MTPELPRLTLYQRSGCHLCEDMRRGLAAWPGRLQLYLVDVDGSPELQRRYGELVPLLAAQDGVEICRYFLDRERLEGFLAGTGTSASG